MCLKKKKKGKWKTMLLRIFGLFEYVLTYIFLFKKKTVANFVQVASCSKESLFLWPQCFVQQQKNHKDIHILIIKQKTIESFTRAKYILCQIMQLYEKTNLQYLNHC